MGGGGGSWFKKFVLNEKDTYEEYVNNDGLTVVHAKCVTGNLNATAEQSWLDLLRQTTDEFKPNSVYTLSFYAKGSGILVTYCYPDVNGKIINAYDAAYNPVVADTMCRHNLTDDWRRYTCTFRTLDRPILGDETKQSYIAVLFRLFEGGNEAHICGAKLEEGATATPWCDSLERLDTGYVEPNLINDSSSLWSSWKNFKYDMSNGYVHLFDDICINYSNDSNLYLGMEFQVRNFTKCSDEDIILGDGENKAGFNLQGTIDGSWYVTPEGEVASEYQEGCSNVFNFAHPINNQCPIKWSFRTDGEASDFTLSKVWKFDMKAVLERFPKLAGNHVLNIHLRTDWIATGQFRYRMLFFKKDNASIPVYACSEMDVAKPNLIHTENKYYGSSIADPITVDDTPNPYLRTGYHVHYTSDAYLPGFYSMASVFEGQTVTYSVYVRALNDMRLHIGCDKWWTKEGQSHQSKNYHTEYIDVPGDYVWRRYSTTWKIAQSESISLICYCDSSYTDVHFEAAGPKLEYSDKPSTWTPGTPANPNIVSSVTKFLYSLGDNPSDGDYITDLDMSTVDNIDTSIKSGWKVKSPVGAQISLSVHAGESFSRSSFYTLSFYYRVNEKYNEYDTLYIQHLEAGADRGGYHFHHVEDKPIGEWKRFTYTFKMNCDTGTIFLFVTNSEVDIMGIKIEEGTEATAYVESAKKNILIKKRNEKTYSQIS